MVYQKSLLLKVLYAFIFNLICLFFLVPSLFTYASTKKTIDISLDQDYESCTFFIKLKESGEYSAKIISPDGDKYNCNKIDKKNLRGIVPDVKAGKWKAVITKKGTESIGKVTVSVTASKNTDNEIASDIKVGKDIVGLKVYLKDDAICADWTDETCGNVSIKVVDLDSNEVLANDTISEKHFEVDIPKAVRKILVSIVPTESSTIRGAERTFTIQTGFNPDATVKLPDGYFTNKEEVFATISMNKSYRYMIENDGEKIAEGKEMLDPGKYKISIPLQKDGEHEIKLYLIDEKGNMRSTSATYNRDTKAPYMSLKKEYDGYKTSNDVLNVEGTVKDYSKITVNDDKITPTTDGHFEKKCILHTGSNKIVIVAADEAGNQTKSSFTITKIAKAKRTFSIRPIILIVIVIMIIVLYNKKRKKE